MRRSDIIHRKTSKNIQKSIDKAANIKIHNILPTVERTFLQIGSTIGKYNIIEEIDRGGMAVVYKALQLDLNREVALKVLPANITINHRFVERFLSEAHAVAKLQHPFIVNIHEVAVENNVYYLAMDYIPGLNLYYYLNFKKPKLVDVLEIAVKLTDALAYAHKQKIIHRDLKLNNIIMRENVTPVLIDFGLAKALEGEEVALTKTGEIMGSPAYMAPERLSGANTDARSDICSMGIMLYEMLTFKNPYLDPRSMPQTTMNVLEANPIPPRKLVPWLPMEIEAITLKAMQKDPDKRYQTMEEFRDDIRRYQKGEPVLANPPSIWSIGRRFWHVYWALLIIGLVVVGFSSLFASYLYFSNKKEQPFWHLTYREEFSGERLDNNWTVHPAANGKESFQWTIVNKALRSPAQGRSFVRWERTVSRDILIEFDIAAASGNLSGAGFFICGSCPDSGYCFHLNSGPDAQCGISFPGSEFLFSDYNPFEFAIADKYHVVVEKRDNGMVFKINDLVIARIWDFFPDVGKNHRNIGFFTNGSGCDFDNVTVSTYTLPQLRGPCVVADGFMQKGEFRDALEEYEEAFQAFSKTDLAEEILLKMCECYIRLGEYGQATVMFGRLKDPMRKNDALLPRRLFIEGIMHDRENAVQSADSAFAGLFALDPEIPLCQSVRDGRVAEAATFMQRDDLASAEKVMALLHRHPSVNHKASGRIFLAILRRYLEKGELDKVKLIGDTVLTAFKSDPDVVLAARTALVRMHLASGNKTVAIDLLNQCVSSFRPSEAAWQAWLELAGVYEYDDNFPDAFTIYKKVYSDCPKNLVLPWFARLKMGELADNVTSEENRERIFTSVIASPHPFVLPRKIAQLYKGDLSDGAFTECWQTLYPGNKEYLIYLAKKAIFDEDPDQAYDYFESFKRSIAPNTWTAMQVIKAISQLEK